MKNMLLIEIEKLLISLASGANSWIITEFYEDKLNTKFKSLYLFKNEHEKFELDEVDIQNISQTAGPEYLFACSNKMYFDKSDFFLNGDKFNISILKEKTEDELQELFEKIRFLTGEDVMYIRF